MFNTKSLSFVKNKQTHEKSASEQATVWSANESLVFVIFLPKSSQET